MTIAEAIEILTQHQKGTDPLYLPDLPNAERLSIEALEYVKRHGPYGYAHPRDLLPGETEE